MIEKLTQAWKEFIATLETPGGTIIILLTSCILLAILALILMHRNEGGESASLIRTTFAGFTGALLLALKSKGGQP